jgi:SAM-dependent methyltransferase
VTTPRPAGETASDSDLKARQAHVLPLLKDMKSILEIGCGEGRTLGLLSSPTRSIVGIDIEYGSLQKAKASTDLPYVHADAQRLPLATATFDAAIALEVLEHIPDWPQALAECFRVAQRVIVSVPFKEWLKGEQCPNCGVWVPLYGHLHAFGPRTFDRYRNHGPFTMQIINAPLGWQEYWLKGWGWLSKIGRRVSRQSGDQRMASAIHTTSEQTGREEESGLLSCPECGSVLPSSLRWQRVVDRLWRLVVRKPEWLLVVWDQDGRQ